MSKVTPRPAANDAVNATVARALTDSDFIRALRIQPGRALSAMGLADEARNDLAALDFQRLWLLSGFVGKVQNNDLWDIFPTARAFLRARRQEAEVFAAYAAAMPDRHGSLRDRSRTFLAFVIATPLSKELVPFRDLARHDYTMASIVRGWTGEAGGAHDRGQHRVTTAARTAPLLPRLRGIVVIQGYQCDPLKCAETLSGNPSDFEGPPDASETFICYSQQDPGSDLRVIRVDPAVALILGAVNGHRSVEEILDASGLNLDAVTVGQVLAEAVDHGLVLTEGPPRQTTASVDRVRDVIQGHAVGRVLTTLEQVGVLDHLTAAADSRFIAAKLQLDHTWLLAILRFLAVDGDIVRDLGDGRFELAIDERDRARLGFELTKFIGAYGACLDHPGPTPDSVNGPLLAAAFAKIRTGPPVRNSLAISVLRECDATNGLLDLGCGTGDLLIALALASPDVWGLGIDANPAMVHIARNRAEQLGVETRAQFVLGDALQTADNLSGHRQAEVQNIYAGSLFNALFGNGSDRPIETLVALRRRFPGRRLFVDDYYGQLGTPRGNEPSWTLLQDLVQTCSGQGIPPADSDAWEDLYRAAGCHILHIYEGEIQGFARFVHVIDLPPLP